MTTVAQDDAWDGAKETFTDAFGEIKRRGKKLVDLTSREGKGRGVLGEVHQELWEILRVLDRTAREAGLRSCERCGKAAIDPAWGQFESEWLMMMTGKHPQEFDHDQGQDPRPVDLCPDCTQSFEAWWSTSHATSEEREEVSPLPF